MLGDVEDARAAGVRELRVVHPFIARHRAWTVMVPPSVIGRLVPPAAAAGSAFDRPKARKRLLVSVAEDVAADHELAVFLDLFVRLRKAGHALRLRGRKRGPPAGDGKLILVAQRRDQEARRREGPQDDEEQQRHVGEDAAHIDACHEVGRAGGRAGDFGGDISGCHQRVPSSALARRMFQIMIGSTASMMITAMVEPRP